VGHAAPHRLEGGNSAPITTRLARETVPSQRMKKLSAARHEVLGQDVPVKLQVAGSDTDAVSARATPQAAPAETLRRWPQARPRTAGSSPTQGNLMGLSEIP